MAVIPIGYPRITFVLSIYLWWFWLYTNKKKKKKNITRWPSWLKDMNFMTSGQKKIEHKIHIFSSSHHVIKIPQQKASSAKYQTIFQDYIIVKYVKFTGSVCEVVLACLHTEKTGTRLFPMIPHCYTCLQGNKMALFCSSKSQSFENLFLTPRDRKISSFTDY